MASTDWILEFVDRTGLDSLGYSLAHWGPQGSSRDTKRHLIVYEVLQTVGLILNDEVSLRSRPGLNPLRDIAKASVRKCSDPVSTEPDIGHC